MGDRGVVETLEEERGVVDCVEGCAIGTGLVLVCFLFSNTYIYINLKRGWEGEGKTHSLIASNCAFLGMTSSIYGSKPGYVSRNFWRRPR